MVGFPESGHITIPLKLPMMVLITVWVPSNIYNIYILYIYIYIYIYILGMKQYYNISIYCNIYFCNTIQYGLKEISIYCTLQYVAMFVALML